jgi:toxin ParE1/3/4
LSWTFSFVPEARDELREAILYYEGESPGLGASFLGAVTEGLEQLLAFPESAPTLYGKVRSKPLHRFPYSLLYSLRQGDVRVLAVMNQRRRPFYWQGRR